MKSVFIAGAVLMIGASIYGFADYKKTSRADSFKKMYEEKNPAPAVIPATEAKPAEHKEILLKEEKAKPVVNDKKTSATFLKNKKTRVPKKIHYKEFSRAPLREDVEIIQPEKSKN